MRLTQRATKGWTQPPFWANADGPIWTPTYGPTEKLGIDFERYVQNVYQRNGVVFACIAARAAVFSQARFLWRGYEDGRPSDLMHNDTLGILEEPWPNGSTNDLLTLMETDVSLAGNCYGTIVDDQDGRRMRRLRPDWVTIVTGTRTGDPRVANQQYDARLLAYVYTPPSKAGAATDYTAVDYTDPAIFTPDQVFHYTEMPDPLHNWRGMSWITPVVREVQGDLASTEHKLRFFDNGAMPAIAVRYDKGIEPDVFEQFVEQFNKSYGGSANAYKALHLGGGSDVTPLTMDFKALDFTAVQGVSETRIAAAAGVPASIVGISAGLEGSSLNAGNFNAARRIFVDGRIRSLWAKAAPALESILPRPGDGSRLWYDDRDIPFLRADAMEEANTRRADAVSIKQLVDAGFHPDAAVAAVTAGDLRKLKGQHSGLYSVQLQPLSQSQGGGTTSGGQ